MTSGTGSVRGGFGGFEKSQSRVSASEEDDWLSERAEARPVVFAAEAVRIGGQMEKLG